MWELAAYILFGLVVTALAFLIFGASPLHSY
jgi:hypothetical protein